ncbi:hypothetical protein VP01_735g2, partial [Puccinia sorghi]
EKFTIKRKKILNKGFERIKEKLGMVIKPFQFQSQFGCSKLKILTKPSDDLIHRQVQLVYALVTLGNFLH